MDKQDWYIEFCGEQIAPPFPITLAPAEDVELALDVTIRTPEGYRRRIMAEDLEGGWPSPCLVFDSPWIDYDPDEYNEPLYAILGGGLGEMLDLTLAHFDYTANRRAFEGVADFARRYGGLSERDAQALLALVEMFGEPTRRNPYSRRR